MKLNQIIIVAVIIAILCIGGCGVYQYGLQTGKQEQQLSVVDNDISNREDTIAGLNLQISDLNAKLDKVNIKYDSVLKVHSRYQIGANIQRNAYVKIIKSLSDSIKSFKVDSIHDDTGMLIAYLNYPIISNQYDLCILDNNIKDSMLIGKEKLISLYRQESELKDKLINDTNKKIDIQDKSIKKNNRGKFFVKCWAWISTGIASVSSSVIYFNKNGIK